MGWISRKELMKKPEVGDYVTTTRDIEACVGKFTAGSRVKIIAIGERGYDISDNEGHEILECGWNL